VAVIALGVATRSEPASATSCVTRSTRIKLVSVTEDGAPGSGDYNGLVVVFGREPGVVDVTARPASSDTAFWLERYHVAAPPSP
jgi:hypothetical protein